ncbi:MAG: LysM peptidoglycan-binding domain-containing protein [Anaerolineales bacterium]|nr:LysM peptidoglycan-binding domain-containing protein [Anaerolineales bacterium]
MVLHKRISHPKLIIVCLFITILVALQTRPTAVQPAAAQGRTGLVLAHYYAWFDPNSFGAGKTPFNPPNPYFSSDAGTIQRHVSEAQSAGIDGFVQAWYGPDASQQTEPNFATLLNIASGSGFKAAVTFEPISGFMPNNDVRASALSTLLSTHANHPAYLRMDGKPVIFFWANWALGVGDWEYIRSIADPDRNSIWIAEGGNMQYLSVFDGMYLYNISWSPDPAGINARWGGETRAATNTYGSYKYWVATAMPGFNDSLLGRGENTIIRDRGNGAYLQNSFSGAAASGPDLIVITSYNEWPEGSNIEPSNEFGSFYLDLTRDLISTYKAGGIPAAVAPPPAPAQESNTAETTGESNSTNSVAENNAAQTTPLPTSPPLPTSTPLPSPTPRSDGAIVYLVQTGDTLISIAIAYDLTLDEIYELNDLGPNSLLSVGQEIIVGYDDTIVNATATAVSLLEPTETSTPAVLDAYPNTTVRDSDGAILYEVAEGNTLIEIALLYGLTIPEIYELNGLDETSLLSVGQSVIVGYVATPTAQGGSADLPQEPPTATATATETATATITPLPPTPTAEATAISALPTAAAPTATVTPAAVAATGGTSGSSFSTNVFLLGLGSVVVVLAGLGGFFLYLGRKVS